ncbi:MAG TPA: hypothetical protein PKC21_02145 [Oligoflexia bacterium]|nr:hypothetical protein [Oligoflexia bacterium]HMR24131.1 hypothetical protein [Oligoflexia bacterium]
MLETLCSFLFAVALTFISLDKCYAKDYRINSSSYRYSGKIKMTADVKEKPWLNSKTIATLRPGDMVSVVSQQGEFYAIRVKQKPEKNIWVKKNLIQLYKKKELTQQNHSPSPAVMKQKTYQKPKKVSVNDKRHNYYIGLVHYKNIKQFSTNQTGVSAFYERRWKQYGLSLNADFLYNDLFKTYSVGPGFKYHFSAKNNYQLSSAMYVGYEKLFDDTRSINAVISHLELLQLNYKYKTVNIILSPLQLRTMLSADQKIPVNFRYGISLGVQF